MYIGYFDLWKYCVEKSYPGTLSHCTVLEKTTTTYEAAVLRLLEDSCQIADYVYTTDVDIMHLPCENIIEYHNNRMAATGLCYSNTPRKKEYLGSQRLTGLHFASREWYHKTKNIREMYLHMLAQGEIGNGRFDDELVLMKVCKESGLGIPPTEPLINRHGGIHLGTFRNYYSHSKNKQNQQLRMRINYQQAECWLKFYDDPEFKKIVADTAKKSRVIKEELVALYSFCMRTINGAH